MMRGHSLITAAAALLALAGSVHAGSLPKAPAPKKPAPQIPAPKSSKTAYCLPTNRPPVIKCACLSYGMVAGDTLTIPVSALVANASDPDRDRISLKSVGKPSCGTAVVSGSNVVYKPGANCPSSVTIAYTVVDARGATATGKICITVKPANRPPVVKNACVPLSLKAGVPVKMTLTTFYASLVKNFMDPDGDMVFVKSMGQSSHLSISVNLLANTITFTAAPNSPAYFEVPYTVTDARCALATGKICVTVNKPVKPNEPPQSQDDCAANITAGNAPINIDVLANDTDPENDALTITAVTQGAHGAVIIAPDARTIIYTPALNYAGEDTFTYTVSDGKGGQDTAKVCIQVSNLPPDGEDDCDNNVLEAGQTITIRVLDNDSDLNGDDLSVVSATNGERGTTVVNADGTITYTANQGASGPDQFTYIVSDGQGGQDTARVCLLVNAPGCSGILLFGPDIVKTIYHYMVNDPNGPRVPAEYVTLWDTGTIYNPATPDQLTDALNAKLAKDGKPYCTMMLDTEYVGAQGIWAGLSATDQARLKQEIQNGMGFVYAEPVSIDKSPLGQIPDVLPVQSYFMCDYTQQYLVVDTTSPLAAGLPSIFNAASSCQNTQLIPQAIPGITYDNVQVVARSVSSDPTAPYYMPGTGGPAVLTLNYGATGGRVALIGTDPYPQSNALPGFETDFPSILRLYYNAVVYTGHFENGIR